MSALPSAVDLADSDAAFVNGWFVEAKQANITTADESWKDMEAVSRQNGHIGLLTNNEVNEILQRFPLARRLVFREAQKILKAKEAASSSTSSTSSTVTISSALFHRLTSPTTVCNLWKRAVGNRVAIPSWLPVDGPGLDFLHDSDTIPSAGGRDPEESYQHHFTQVVQTLPTDTQTIAHDTHRTRIIANTYSPDYITTPRGFAADGGAINAIIEIKPEHVVFSDSMRGQVLLYCQSLLAEMQPGRTEVTAALTDCRKVQFIRVEKMPKRSEEALEEDYRVHHSHSYDLSNADGVGNRMFRHLLTTCTFLHTFAIDGLVVTRLLFSSSNTQVFAVQDHADRVVKMHVSLRESVMHEASILQRLANANVPGVTRLVPPGYNIDAPRALLLTPRAMCSVASPNHPDAVTSAGLASLLATLQAMHAAGVYHRDLRATNWLIHDDLTMTVCDFDHAIYRAPGNDEVAEMSGAHRFYWSAAMEELFDAHHGTFLFTAVHELQIFVRAVRLLYLPEHRLSVLYHAANAAARRDFWLTELSNAPWPAVLDAINHSDGPQYATISNLIASLPNPLPRSGVDVGRIGEAMEIVQTISMRGTTYSDVYMPIIAEAFYRENRLAPNIYQQIQQHYGTVTHPQSGVIVDLIRVAISTGALIMTDDWQTELHDWLINGKPNEYHIHHIDAGIQDSIMNHVQASMDLLAILDELRASIHRPMSETQPRRSQRRSMPAASASARAPSESAAEEGARSRRRRTEPPARHH